MLQLLRLWKACARRAKLERLVELAKQIDDLLLAATLTPDTRWRLRRKREDLEDQIQALMTA